jgi:riboflavin-specific deaminase-like protein
MLLVLDGAQGRGRGGVRGGVTDGEQRVSRLTVRLVPGASPLRVVLDSTLRTPSSALLLEGGPPTLVLTTDRATEDDRQRVRATGAGVCVLPAGPGGVDLVAGLRALRERGVRSLLVEGGARVITSLLSGGLVDRAVIGTAPKIIGAGKEAVGDLGIGRVAEGIVLRNRFVHLTADDVVTAWDVSYDVAGGAPASRA